MGRGLPRHRGGVQRLEEVGERIDTFTEEECGFTVDTDDEPEEDGTEDEGTEDEGTRLSGLSAAVEEVDDRVREAVGASSIG